MQSVPFSQSIERGVSNHARSGFSVDQISQALKESLQWACSKDQVELCKIYNIASSSELQRFQNYVHQFSSSGWTDMRDWTRTMTEYVVQLRDCYNAHLETQRVRHFESDQIRTRLLAELQLLSEQLEDCGLNSSNKHGLLGALRQIRNSWRHQRKSDTEKILLSVLSSMQLCSHRCRIIKADRSHWKSLGLGFRSLGKHYLVFEASSCSKDDKERSKSVVRAVAKDFCHIFEENVAQNMARIQNNHCSFQLVDTSIDDLATKVQRLSTKIFSSRSPSTLILNEQANHSNDDLSTQGDAVFDVNMAVQTIFNGTRPEFQPAAWDWPHLLKLKVPAKCREKRFRQLFRIWTPSTKSYREKANTAYERFWTVSISRLAEHFNKGGQVYYTSMVNNGVLIYAHQFRLFERVVALLLKCHWALQLEHGHENLVRVLILIQKLQLETQKVNMTFRSFERSSFLEI